MEPVLWARSPSPEAKGWARSPAGEHRSIYVMVCAGINHIATDLRTPREDSGEAPETSLLMKTGPSRNSHVRCLCRACAVSGSTRLSTGGFVLASVKGCGSCALQPLPAPAVLAQRHSQQGQSLSAVLLPAGQEVRSSDNQDENLATIMPSSVRAVRIMNGP
jgi:hypothetical protein